MRHVSQVLINQYLADHKDAVIDLLRRVTTVSVQTVRIVEAMRLAPR
jgi:predicted helicase